MFLEVFNSDLGIPCFESSGIGSLEIEMAGSFRIFCSITDNFEYHPFPFEQNLDVDKFLFPGGFFRCRGILYLNMKIRRYIL